MNFTNLLGSICPEVAGSEPPEVHSQQTRYYPSPRCHHSELLHNPVHHCDRRTPEAAGMSVYAPESHQTDDIPVVAVGGDNVGSGAYTADPCYGHCLSDEMSVKGDNFRWSG